MKLVIELDGGPRATLEGVADKAFGRAVAAALEAPQPEIVARAIGSVHLGAEPEPISKTRTKFPANAGELSVASRPHGELSRRARELALGVLRDGDWHPKGELNRVWRSDGLRLETAGRALSGHVEKRKNGSGAAEWRLDPGSELWDDTIEWAPQTAVNGGS